MDDDIRIRWDGTMNSDLERRLGHYFNSWLPGHRQLELRTPTGYVRVNPGDTITMTRSTVTVTHA